MVQKQDTCPPGAECFTCKICKTTEEVRERIAANTAAGIIPQRITNEALNDLTGDPR